MSTFCIDLLLENGALIRIKCPEKHRDACHETLGNAMKRGDTWSPLQFDGCSAEYLGLYLDRVNMGKVVGML